MTADYHFGFLKEPLSLSGPTCEIIPLDDLDDVVRAALTSPSAGSVLFHPPLCPPNRERVVVPTPRFELPTTHRLVTLGRPQDPEFGEFLILILGFMLGLRLTLDGAGHLQATPHRVGQLVSFRPSKNEVAGSLEKAVEFWDRNTPDMRRLMFGAVHYYLVAQGYAHLHEQFAWMYTVMDSLHRIAWHVDSKYRRKIPEKSGHARRPRTLAEHFLSPLPVSFCNPLGKLDNVDRLINARHHLVPEARWEGEPLGYGFNQEGHDLCLDLTFFVHKLYWVC